MGRFDPLPTDPYQRPPGAYGAHCAACREVTKLGTRFCTNCNAFRDDAEHSHTIRYATSRWMRFGARLVDSVIVLGLSIAASYILDAVDLIEFGSSSADSMQEFDLDVGALIGTGIWFLWFAFLASRGQTPGKWIVRTKVIGTEGGEVARSRLWLRELLLEGIPLLTSILGASIVGLPSVAAQILFYVAGSFLLVDAAAIFFSPDRQTIHDRIFGTLVVNVRPVRQPSAELRAL